MLHYVLYILFGLYCSLYSMEESLSSSAKKRVPALKLDSLKIKQENNNKTISPKENPDATSLNLPSNITTSCSMNDVSKPPSSLKQSRRSSYPDKMSKINQNRMIISDSTEYISTKTNDSPNPQKAEHHKRSSFIKTYHTSPRNVSSISISLPNSRPTTPRKSMQSPRKALTPRKKSEEKSLFSKESHDSKYITICGVPKENLSSFLIKKSNIYPSTQKHIKNYALNALNVVLDVPHQSNMKKIFIDDLANENYLKNGLVFLYVNRYCLNLLSVIPIQNFIKEDADIAHLCVNYLIDYVNMYSNKEIKWPNKPTSLQDHFEQLFDNNRTIKHKEPFIANIITQFLLKQRDEQLKLKLKKQYDNRTVLGKDINNSIDVYKRLLQ